jgi:hypothetical protein
MLPSHFVERYLADAPAELQDIARELRSLVASAAPQACEKVHSRGLTFFDAQRGGPVSAGICQIAVYDDHVRLAFVHGAFLPDPAGLLEGDRRAKRYVRLRSYREAPWDDLRRLIVASVRFDPRTLSANSLPTRDR